MFIALVGVLFSSEASAQNIQTSTIEWNSISTFEAQSGTISDEATKVVSSAEQIIWYDKNGIAQKTFSITTATGTWPNVSSNGSIIYNVSYGDNSGVAHFSKLDHLTKIRLHLITEEGSPIYELVVTTITEL